MTRHEMICWLMARDICSLISDFQDRDYSFAWSIMMGEGWTQWNSMSDEQVRQEFDEVEWEDILDPERFEEIRAALLEVSP